MPVQLYIKARGLYEAIVSRTAKNPFNEPITINKLRELLTSLKMPVVKNTPVHVEIILRIEEKSVLSFFISENTFQNLTDGDSEYWGIFQKKN